MFKSTLLAAAAVLALVATPALAVHNVTISNGSKKPIFTSPTSVLTLEGCSQTNGVVNVVRAGQNMINGMAYGYVTGSPNYQQSEQFQAYGPGDTGLEGSITVLKIAPDCSRVTFQVPDQN